MGIAVFPSEETQLQYQKGSEWLTIPGVSSYRETGGDAPTREVVGFEATATLTGRRRVPTVECDVASYSPHTTAWRDIRKASDDQSFLRFRLRMSPATIFSKITGVQFTTSGVGEVTVTGAGRPDLNSDDYAPGLIFVRDDDSTFYIIDSIVDADTLKVVDSGGGVIAANSVSSAEEFSIRRPALIRGPFSAKVATTDRAQIGSESNLITSIRLQPNAELPPWTAAVNRS